MVPKQHYVAGGCGPEKKSKFVNRQMTAKGGGD